MFKQNCGIFFRIRIFLDKSVVENKSVHKLYLLDVLQNMRSLTVVSLNYFAGLFISSKTDRRVRPAEKKVKKG